VASARSVLTPEPSCGRGALVGRDGEVGHHETLTGTTSTRSSVPVSCGAR